MSVLYCTIPHFAAALARRDHPEWMPGPLVLIGPEDRVFGISAEAAASGISVGMTARMARIRCPEAQLLDTDLALCRAEREALLQLLEGAGPGVEPHGWGAAYVDLGHLVQGHADAVAFCGEVGRAVRQELGQVLQPALGWDSSKFTALAAARRTPPGRLRAVDAVRERGFLQPLPISLLSLSGEALQRLCFLGLRSLGQYAALPRAAVWQQFGRAGMVAHRCARGEDDRPIVPRWQETHLAAEIDFETPLVEQARLVAALRHLISPLLAELRGNLQACGQVCLTVRFEDGSAQERARAFLFPVADEEQVVRTMDQLLAGMNWQAAATALAVSLAQIQDTVAEQLKLFPLEDEHAVKLQAVERYLATRFGPSFKAGRLRQAVMAQPDAPLPEWRVSWQQGEKA